MNAECEEIRQLCKVRYILYIAFVCNKDPRRCQKYPKTYKPKAEYKAYPNYISGPCYQLFELITRNHENNLSAKEQKEHFKSLCKSICDKYISYNTSAAVPNTYYDIYDYLCKTIDNDCSLIQTDISNKLIDDSYYDLYERIIAYNNYNRLKKFDLKELEKVKKETVNNEETNIELTLSQKACERIIKTLNEEYSNSDKEPEIRIKLENIFLPVLCRSPFASICIVHKNNLPKTIRSTIEKDINFVFVFTTIRYEMNQSRDNSEYNISNRILTDEYIKNSSTLINTLFSEGIYYPMGDHDKCPIISSYTSMKARYEQLCPHIMPLSCQDDSTITWLPLMFPNNAYKNISKSLRMETKISISELILPSNNTVSQNKQTIIENQGANEYIQESAALDKQVKF